MNRRALRHARTYCPIGAATCVLALAGCRAADDCYKTYPEQSDSPTERAMSPQDDRPKVEPAPDRPTAETLPPPSNPNNVPR